MPTSLVYDPDPTAAERLCRLLTLLDVKAMPVYTAQAVYIALAESRPDLIFLSSIDQGHDVEACILEWIRKQASLVNTPIVLVSDSAAGDRSQTAFPEGVLDIIPRSVPLECVERVLIRSGLIR
jgi:PleD family two-component response regulator